MPSLYHSPTRSPSRNSSLKPRTPIVPAMPSPPHTPTQLRHYTPAKQLPARRWRGRWRLTSSFVLYEVSIFQGGGLGQHLLLDLQVWRCEFNESREGILTMKKNLLLSTHGKGCIELVVFVRYRFRRYPEPGCREGACVDEYKHRDDRLSRVEAKQEKSKQKERPALI